MVSLGRALNPSVCDRPYSLSIFTQELLNAEIA